MVSSISRPCSPNDSPPANSDPVSMHLPELPSFSPLGAIVALPSSPKVAPSESVTLDSQTAFSMISSPHTSAYIFSKFSSMPTSAISSAMAAMLATPSVHTSNLPTNSSESHDLVLPNPSPSPVIMDDITPQVLPTNSIDAETSIIDPVLCSLPLSPAESIVDLYSVDGVRRDSESKPFLTKVTLFGPKGVTTNLEANIDDGAMINALDYDTYCKHSRRLQTLQPSSRRL
ncbi:hypothetical protein PAXINDRAFT_13063 [Paxillus involutus ATCC 200175]|uniref:Uncharacterized protein n=1 Tax=Paxillus involutus ATCC 200175 TaxID=664439 RepID=A0A0C9TV68_PAXIN|nr:hypothetical protein PAXINDRAFT_13063 [Paxillus involutus ATCC 200175]